MDSFSTSFEEENEIYVTYTSQYRPYGLSCATKENDSRIAITTFIQDEYINKLQILQPTYDGKSLEKIHETDHLYPPTRVVWSPASLDHPVGLIATAAEHLRIWTFQNTTTLTRHSTLKNRPKDDKCTLLTSCDWSEINPKFIGTTSTDNICTIWDLENVTRPRDEFAPHNDGVLDISFSNAQDTLATVGGDGFVRLFDLRDLRNYTTLYATEDKMPMLQVEFNKVDERYLASFQDQSTKVYIHDLRKAGTPILEMDTHFDCINSISWSPHSRGHLCSAGDDKTLVGYDITTNIKNINGPPKLGVELRSKKKIIDTTMDTNEVKSNVLFHSTEYINTVQWSKTHKSSIAVCDEKATHLVQV